MRRREALMEEFSDSSPKKLLDDEDESSDFIEHKKSSSTKKKGVKKNSHNRTFSSSSTGSNGSNSGNVTFGYGKKHTRTQSSTSSTGSTGGGYQSSGIYDGDSSPSPVVTDNYESNKYSVSNSSFDKYKGISSRDMGKVHSMPAISESYENTYSNDPRIGSMKSNYYEQARKRQNEESGPYILQVIADMLKYIYSSITETATAGGSKLTGAVSGLRKTSDTNPRIGGDFPSPEIYLEPEKKQILEQFKKYCSKKFDVDNEKHQKLLFSLYRCCTQKKTILTEGEHWKFLGFQNTKPETDFRGAGILGLRNLLYFSKHYKKRFKNFFGKCTSDEISVTEDGTFTSYPFVIAGLNVTMLLLSFLGIGFQASKVHNVTAKKNFIDLLTSDRGKPVLEEEEDEEDEEDSTPVVTEGTLLSFDDIPEQKPKKKGINILEDEVSPIVWDNGSLSWDEPKSPVSTSKNSSAAATSTKKLTVASSPVKTSQKSDKKKKAKANTETHQFNLDLFNEMYVVGFTCLHREWHKTKATYFDFGRVLDNTRKHLEDLLELRFNSFEDVKEFNQSLKN